MIVSALREHVASGKAFSCVNLQATLNNPPQASYIFRFFSRRIFRHEATFSGCGFEKPGRLEAPPSSYIYWFDLQHYQLIRL